MLGLSKWLAYKIFEVAKQLLNNFEPWKRKFAKQSSR